MVLALSGSYSNLLTYSVFASVFFGGLMVAAVYRLRRTHPEMPRPYRCWGYPVTPALYLLICVPFLIYVIQGDPVSTLLGVGLVVSGIPFYMAWKGGGRSGEQGAGSRERGAGSGERGAGSREQGAAEEHSVLSFEYRVHTGD